MRCSSASSGKVGRPHAGRHREKTRAPARRLRSRASVRNAWVSENPPMRTRLNAAAVQLSVRAALSAGLGATFSGLLGLQMPVHAVVSAVLVTDLNPKRTRAVGLPRLVGTLIGAGFGATLCTLFGPSPVRMGVGILLAMLLTYVLHLKDAAKVSGYVCGMVLLSFGEKPWWYAAHRLAETALGVTVAVLVSFVPLLNTQRRARHPSGVEQHAH
jgi:uncharacterized membrane protein YgaE (UPF0421/DUF939 family)